MKYLLCTLITFHAAITFSQPVLIAIDDNPAKYGNGYRGQILVDKARTIDGLTFFTTPNWRLYQTDGTKEGTKVLMQFPAQSLVYLQAVTKKWIYYSIQQYGVQALYRMDRTTMGKQPVMYGNYQVNMEVAFTAIYTSPSKDEVAIRLFQKSITHLLALHDNKSDGKADVVTVNLPGGSSSTITIFSDIAFLGRQIFYNGMQQYDMPNTPQKGAEITITASAPGSNPAASAYDIVSVYNLRTKGFDLMDGFHRIQDSLFTYGFYENAQTKKKDLAIASLHRTTIRVPAVREINMQNITARVLDDALYFANGRQVLRWKPGQATIDEVFKKDSLWPKSLQPGVYLLKSGHHFIFRETDNDIRMYDELTKKFTSFPAPPKVYESNSLYKYLEHVTYATPKGFFYVIEKDGVQVFMRLDPNTNTHEAIAFPEYKNERFGTITNIFQAGNRFYFLTEYLGKKEKPVYRIFTLE